MDINFKYTLLLILPLLILLSCNNDNITYKPIGFFHTKYTIKTGAPRQGMLDTSSRGIIILKDEYIKGLKYLDKFEYIFVLYHFHEAKGWDNIVRPPESEHKFGLFATRSPRRPNPIGLSLIKLDSIRNNKLFVSNIDAFNGTPVLDIKPFLPTVDSEITFKNMEAEAELGHHDENFINDSLVKIFVKGE